MTKEHIGQNFRALLLPVEPIVAPKILELGATFLLDEKKVNSSEYLSK